MRDILRILVDLGISAKEENALLVRLSEQGQKDARFTKIIAFVALLYLPATLIAVSEYNQLKNESLVDTTCLQSVFSSNLVQTVSTTDPAERTRMIAAPQFWTFPVLTIVLTMITIIPAIIYDRVQTKKYAEATGARYRLQRRPS
jgi:hypothetical protein